MSHSIGKCSLVLTNFHSLQPKIPRFTAFGSNQPVDFYLEETENLKV